MVIKQEIDEIILKVKSNLGHCWCVGVIRYGKLKRQQLLLMVIK